VAAWSVERAATSPAITGEQVAPSRIAAAENTAMGFDTRGLIFVLALWTLLLLAHLGIIGAIARIW
jgi:hypothetical protein